MKDEPYEKDEEQDYGERGREDKEKLLIVFLYVESLLVGTVLWRFYCDLRHLWKREGGEMLKL